MDTISATSYRAVGCTRVAGRVYLSGQSSGTSPMAIR